MYMATVRQGPAVLWGFVLANQTKVGVSPGRVSSPPRPLPSGTQPAARKRHIPPTSVHTDTRGRRGDTARPRFGPRPGCREVTQDPAPSRGQRTTLAPRGLSSVPRQGHGGTQAWRPGPFTPRSPRAREQAPLPPNPARRGEHKPRASLSSPLRRPGDTPAVPGPRAGDKGIFAVLETGDLQTERRKAYKTHLSQRARSQPVSAEPGSGGGEDR